MPVTPFVSEGPHDVRHHVTRLVQTTVIRQKGCTQTEPCLMSMDMPMMAYASGDKSGEVHAVPSRSEDTSLCGGHMCSYPGRAWPLAASLWDRHEPQCPQCHQAVYGIEGE